MDPRRVLTFRAVAHQRSFSRAARELALSQPSVSNQVAALEREIGPGCSTASPAACGSPARARSCSSTPTPSPSASSSPASNSPPPPRPQRARLRIGAFPTALAGLVPAAIARVRDSQHPDTQVTVDEGSDEDLPARVRAGELHLALGFQDAALPRHEPPGLERRDLFREQFMVALAPDHPLAQAPRGPARRPPRRRLDRRRRPTG